MQIWFYKRDAQVGDYVYADGTWSDKLNKLKTVVGLCFYIDPEDKTHRLCVGTKDIISGQWGLFPDNWNTEITLTDDPSYNVFDLPSLTNYNMAGLVGNAVNESSYRDNNATSNDGFRILEAGTAVAEIGWQKTSTQLFNHPIGSSLPIGLINTLKIIQHRDKILQDSGIGLQIPKSYEDGSGQNELNNLMEQLISKNGYQNKYGEYYYPSASQCNLYTVKPKEGELLSDKFKPGNWFLPSAGELARIYWWHIHNINNGTQTNGIFEKAVSEGVFESLGISHFFTSTETNNRNVWVFVFNNGTIAQQNKGSSYLKRPVCAF